MRILALLTDAYGGYGGISQYNRDLLEALTADPLRAEIVALVRSAAPGSTDLPPVNVKQLEPRSSKIGYAAASMRAAVAHGPFDLVFCGHLYMAALGLAVGKILGRPTWMQLHGVDAWDIPSTMTRSTVEAFDLVTAVSRDTRSRFLEWSNISPYRVKVLPNTVDDIYQPGPEPEGIRQRYNMNGKRVIMTVARLSAEEKYKGHAEIIEAMPKICSACPDAAYLIVGDGDDRERLEQLRAASPARDSIVFAGRVPIDDLPGLYRMADVMAMPSAGEGFGIVYLEATASGTPALGIGVGGAVDGLGDGTLGIIADPESLADSLIDVLNSPPDRWRDLPGATQARFGREKFAEAAQLIAQSIPSLPTFDAKLSRFDRDLAQLKEYRGNGA